jgi:outer membrane protein assembly factor BamB
LLIAINGSGYCDLHVLRFIEKGTQAEPAQVIRIATGPVKSPPTRLGRWMLYLAETGDLKILELNTAEIEAPVRKLAEDRFENRGGDRLYMIAEGSDLWIASKGINRYRVKTALGQFERQSIVSHSDFFLGPIAKIDTYLFHLRRRDGSKQVSVAAVDSQTLAEVWRTDFGASSPAGPTSGGAGMIVVSSQGDVFKIDQVAIESQAANSPVKSSNIDQPLSFVDRVVLDAEQHVYVGPSGTGDVLLVNNQTVTSKLSRMQAPADSPACSPIGLGSDLLVPTTKGQVVRVNPSNGQIIGNPFQPSLRPGQETQWNRPVITGEGFAVIGDMQRTVYALDTSDRQGLREVSKLVTDGNVMSDFGTDGQSTFAVIDVAGVHRLIRMDMAGGQLTVAATVDLPGQIVDGPRIIGKTVFTLLDNGKLHSFDIQCQAGWELDVQNQRLAGISARADSGWEVALVSGRILRVNIQGTVDQTLEIGQPIRQSPIVIGQNMFVSAADGTLLMLDPQKF